MKDSDTTGPVCPFKWTGGHLIYYMPDGSQVKCGQSISVETNRMLAACEGNKECSE